MPTPSLAAQRQIDIICDQFENEWDANGRPNFTSFTDLVDNTLREPLLRMLLEIDVELRLKAKHTIEVADYLDAGKAASLYVSELLKKKPIGEAPTPRTDLPDKTGHTPARTINPEFDETHRAHVIETDIKTLKHIGRYRLESILGKGSYGVVYKAYDGQLERHVAIKVPHARLTNHADNVQPTSLKPVLLQILSTVTLFRFTMLARMMKFRAISCRNTSKGRTLQKG